MEYTTMRMNLNHKSTILGLIFPLIGGRADGPSGR